MVRRVVLLLTRIAEHARDQKYIEHFLNQVMFDVADMFIVVVNDITSSDNEYIRFLQRMLMANRTESKAPFIVLVHNYMKIDSVKDATEHWKVRLANSYNIRCSSKWLKRMQNQHWIHLLLN